jgi:hypothetical protein
MLLIWYHLGLRQAVMALMNWAIDVPQKLLQYDAKPFLVFFSKKKRGRLIFKNLFDFLK